MTQGIRWLTGLFWLLVLGLAIQLFWWLITPMSAPQPSASLPQYMAQGDGGGVVNTQGLKERALFGKESVQTADKPASRNAPVTQLNVRLIGVSASSIPSRSAAIIEQRGSQQVYIVGDKLEGTSVTIEQIYADRVILNNGGNEESLPLEDIGEQRPAFSLQIQSEAPLEPSDTADTAEAAAQIKANPQSMLDYVDISPVLVNGSLKGYLLRPGNRPELFNQAGFKSGDIAIAINGLDLTNMQEAMEAGQLLRDAQLLAITILRNDEQMELELEL